MPEANLKSTNIDSRLSYLKKHFNALLEIKHKGSGFGWDDGLKMVTGDRTMFNEWAKSHKDARSLYRKPFPLFDSLEEIYSKDRAIGVSAANPLDRDDEDVTQETIPMQETEVNLIQGEASTVEGSGTSKRSGDATSSRPPKKKLRKNKEITNLQKSFESMMGKMLENSNAQIAQLTTLLEPPKNVKVGLREELATVPGITRSNVLNLCLKMSEDEVIIFRELTDDDEKYDFLGMILAR